MVAITSGFSFLELLALVSRAKYDLCGSPPEEYVPDALGVLYGLGCA